jgi:antitoxin MazE
METKIRKWGNSLGLRIPKTFAEQTGVREGSTVDISVEADRLVVTPVRVEAYRLADLLDRVTKDNLHDEIDFGDPRGKEVW